MNDVDRLLEWFGNGTLLRPNAETPGTVHLARALAALSGAPLQLDAPSRRLATAIGESDHHVFVLADGLGMNLIHGLPEDSFLRRHLATPISSVFPSSTAPSLTAIATGMWPAEHGVTGWFVYLRDRDLHTIALPFVERFSGTPLDQIGTRSDELFTQPPLWATLQRDTALFMNRRIADSTFTRYVSGGHPVWPYDDLDGAMDAISNRVDTSLVSTFTYLYYSGVDTAAHLHGPSSNAVAARVKQLDVALGRLAETIAGKARIVVSADHGGYDVRREQKLVVEPADGLSELLLTPPAGEPTAPGFHVRPGRLAEFASRFRAWAGDDFVLLTVDELDDLRLLGPEPLSPATLQRIGDFVALSANGRAVVYGLEPAFMNMKGFHGGLMPLEVQVPLVVA